MATATETSPMGAINEALKVLRKLRSGIEAERTKVNAEIDKRKVALDVEIERHERAKKLLGGKVGPTQRSGKAKKLLDPATVAGPKALKATEEMVRDLMRAPQSEITKRTKLNSGSVSYALRALESEGKVRRTGEVEGRSPVWEIVTPNGSKRSTRVAPGT